MEIVTEENTTEDDKLEEGLAAEEILTRNTIHRMKDMDLEGPDESTSLTTSTKLESFDDALPHVGDFGRYQLLLILAIFPYAFGYSFLYFSQFFFTLTPREHWCKIPELMDSFTTEQRIEAAIPQSDKSPFYDTCRRKDLNFTALLARGINDYRSSAWTTNKTVKCETWEYDLTVIPYASIGAELDWVCENSYLISTAQTIFYCGSITGGFLFGWIADHRGRIPALILCSGCGLIASFATAWTSTFWSFVIARFFTGLAFDNVINIPLIIVLEYVAVGRRSVVVNVTFGVYFALGSTLLPWAAYYIADWRILCYVSALPLFSCFVTHWILPESARWYVSNKMSDKVIEKLKRIARINGVKPKPHFYEVFYRQLNSSDNRVESANLADIFRMKRLARITILLTLYWSLSVIAFDGHIYSLKLLESSVFVSFSLTCVTELPAGILLTILLERWGRRFCGFITLALTTAFSIAQILLLSETAKLVMSVSSRFALNMATNIALQYAAELLPTPVRAQGVAMIHIFGILAHGIAPYIVDSAQIWEDLPMVIISCVSCTSAILVLFLPETLGQAMPQTLQEGEDFGKDQSFWSLPCLGGSNKKKSSSKNNDSSSHSSKL